MKNSSNPVGEEICGPDGSPQTYSEQGSSDDGPQLENSTKEVRANLTSSFATSATNFQTVSSRNHRKGSIAADISKGISLLDVDDGETSKLITNHSSSIPASTSSARKLENPNFQNRNRFSNLSEDDSDNDQNTSSVNHADGMESSTENDLMSTSTYNQTDNHNDGHQHAGQVQDGNVHLIRHASNKLIVEGMGPEGLVEKETSYEVSDSLASDRGNRPQCVMSTPEISHSLVISISYNPLCLKQHSFISQITILLRQT